MARTPVALLTTACLLTPLLAAQGDDPIDFQKQILPILEESCVSCHGAKKQKGKLRLDGRDHAFDESRDPRIIVGGNAEESELYARISLPADDLDIMPAEGDRLADEKIALIKRWIDAGAAWPEGAGGSPKPDPRPSLYEKITLPELTEEQKATDARAVEALRARGALALAVSRDGHARDVSFALLGDDATDADLKLLAGLEPTLVWLNLTRTAVTDAGLASLQKHQELRRLHLARTGIGDAGLAHLVKLRKLEYLNLFGTPVSDAGVEHLKKLTKLKKLYVWQTEVTEDGVAALRESLPQVEVIREVRTLVSAKPAISTDHPECCQKAEAKGERCKHPCCVEAAARGEVCKKCPKPEVEAEAKEVATLPPCCQSAKDQGKDCAHPCCVEARGQGKICEKCAK